MSAFTTSSKTLFCGAAHLDRLGRTNAPSVAGTSNPGMFIERPGGAAINSASVFAGLGGDAGLLTILGTDNAAHDIILAAEHRGLALSAQTGDRTGSYTAILEPDGNLVIGLADMAVYDAFDTSIALQATRELAETDWLFLDANLPAQTLLRLARGTNSKVAATTTSFAKASRLQDALPHIDVLFTNDREVNALFGPDVANIETIIVTNAANPVRVTTGALEVEVEVPAQLNIKDVTGAGDALAGACLFALTRGKSIEQAITLGVHAAQAILAVDGPWRPDLRETVEELNGIET